MSLFLKTAKKILQVASIVRHIDLVDERRIYLWNERHFIMLCQKNTVITTTYELFQMIPMGSGGCSSHTTVVIQLAVFSRVVTCMTPGLYLSTINCHVVEKMRCRLVSIDH